jgi:hypothetical protein
MFLLDFGFYAKRNLAALRHETRLEFLVSLRLRLVFCSGEEHLLVGAALLRHFPSPHSMHLLECHGSGFFKCFVVGSRLFLCDEARVFATDLHSNVLSNLVSNLFHGFLRQDLIHQGPNTHG